MKTLIQVMECWLSFAIQPRPDFLPFIFARSTLLPVISHQKRMKIIRNA